MFDTSLSALTAAGGNSRLARSMRAKLQWRDRFGRWIEMGRGVKFKVRGADGATRSVIGSFVGAKSTSVGQVYVQKDPNGLPDGFYDVDSSNAQEFIANLDEAQLASRGIEVGKDANGRAVGERATEAVPNINQMKVAAAPEGWEAIPGTFGGKKVIQTDDGDFRVHFGGKDEAVLLEDHRAAPGQAEPQRSVGEAFKRVGDVDVQREESGDGAYTGLAEGNDEALANRDRDSKIEQIKGNERTLANEKANLGAKQSAMTANETLKKELEAEGQPYDPEGNDSDEALAAREAAPEAAPEAADPATPEAGSAPIASTGEVDLSTFDVSPEGFLIPTGKSTNDISRDGLANFMTAEKESLGSGGSRLVVDTDAKTAEIYNSADTLDDAKAQAGGLGTDTVLDLSTGQPVKVLDEVVDPNSADVNPNLDGDTSADAPSGGAPNAEDRDPNAVESQPANPGADAPASGEPNAEARDGGDPAARAANPGSDRPEGEGTGPAASDPAAGDPNVSDAEYFARAAGGGAISRRAEARDALKARGYSQEEIDSASREVIQDFRDAGNNVPTMKETRPAFKTKVEELQARRDQAQSALNNSGDPKDIIALNEQIDALDNRISAESGSPLDENGKRVPDEDGIVTEPEDVRDWTDVELDDFVGDEGARGGGRSEKSQRVREEILRRREEAPEAKPERMPTDVESRQKLVGDLTDEELIAEINRMDQAADIAEENNSSTDQLDAHLDNLRGELNRRAGELDNPENWTAPEELDDTSLDSELKARSEMEWGAGARPDQDETRIRELASEQARRANPEGAQRLRESQMAEEMALPEGPIEDVPESELYNILETNEKVNFRQLQKQDWDTLSRIRKQTEAIRTELSRRDIEAGKQPRFPTGKTDDDGVDELGYRWGAEIRVSGTDMRNNALDTREFLGNPEEPNGTWAKDPEKLRWKDYSNAPAGSILGAEEPDGTTRYYRKNEEDDWEQLKSADSDEVTGVSYRGDHFLMSTDKTQYFPTDESGQRPGTEPEAPATAEWSDDRIGEWRDKLKDPGAPEGTAGQAWATQELMGMGAAPEQLSDADFDAFEGEELFRGVSSEENKEQFVSGPNWTGTGGNGSGLYMSTNRGHAGRYGNFEDARIIDAKLKPDANIVDAADLEARRQADFDRHMENDNRLAAQLASGDLNLYASSIGVDGYRVELEGVPSVVLANRNAVVVRSSSVQTPEADRPEYQEPGDAEAAAKARAKLDAIDAEIEERLAAAEDESDPQEQQEHLSRIRTLERQRKIQENALNRALGNQPMDFNGELGWSMRNRDNRGELPDTTPAPAPVPEPEEAPEADTPAALDTSIPDTRAAAETRLADAEKNYDDVLKDPDYTEEQYEAAEQARADAQRAVDELDAPETPEDAPEAVTEPVEAPDPRVAELEAERDRLQQVIERNGQDAPRTDGRIGQNMYGEEEAGERVATARDRLRAVNDEIAERENIESQLDLNERTGGLYKAGDDPYNVESGNQNKVEAIKAKMQGKDLSEEERAELDQALGSGLLTDNQVARLSEVVDAAPNAANTGSTPRPEADQPNYLSRADQDIIQAERDDPNFVFDEDLTWRTVKQEYPDAIQLDNGDMILETVDKRGKKYDLALRRTRQNRFMVYVMETDGKGVRRAKRITNSEQHSYEALENRIQEGRILVNSSSPAGSISRRRDYPTELLGAQSFPADDFLGDIGNADAPLPETGDEKFDRLLGVAAMHIRSGDMDIDGIEDELREMDPGATAVTTIMNAIIGRAQDNYRPDTINPWQTYDGETAEIGAEYDWTDWHQQLDWWLPNGKRNPNRKPNRNYGKVHRVRVMKYVEKNTDGKGHTYGDHVYVSVQNEDGTWGNWSSRSAQTLRRAVPGSATGQPFFSKKEEWRATPEALSRRFRVPNAEPGDNTAKTKARPKGELPQSRRLRFTNGGNLAGYGNVPVPNSPAEIAGMITSEEITPRIAAAKTARPGMLIARRDDNGNQFVDSIIRVDALGDGGFRIHAARPDGKGSADVDTFVVPGDADIAIWSAPELRAPAKPEPDNSRQGEVVSIGETGTPGVILHDDGDGSLVVSTSEGVVDVPAAEVKAPEEGEYPTVEFLQQKLEEARTEAERLRNDKDSFLSARANTNRIHTLESMIELADEDWKTEARVLVFDGKVASGEPRQGQYGMYYVLSDEAAAAYGKRFFNPSQARDAEKRDAAKGFTYEDVKVPVTITGYGQDFKIETGSLVGQDISVLRDTEVQTNAPSADSRSDLLSITDELNIPDALRDLLRRWAMNPNVSDSELDGIMSLMRNFNTMNPIERLVNQILNRLGVSGSVRSSILNNN